MPSIKHLRDVNIDSLNSPTRQKFRDNAPAASTERHTKSPESSMTDSIKQLSLKTRRSTRVSRTSKEQSDHPLGLGRRRSAASASMEPSDNGNPDRDARNGSRSREIDLPDSSIRYTPITGRVSRAKKGQLVHVCNRCGPPRVFSRAEHLRRHALCHDKPRYRCTFDECGRKFHRYDLLARHTNAHGARGEQNYTATGSQNGGSTSSVESQSPPCQEEAPLVPDSSETYIVSGRQSISPENTTGSGSTDEFCCYDEMIPPFRDLFSNPSAGPSIAPPDPPVQQSWEVGTTINERRTSTDLKKFSPYQNDTAGNAAYTDSPQNRNQSPLIDACQNASPHNRQQPLLPSLITGMPEPPILIHTSSSPWSPTDSQWSTPSDASRPGTAWITDHPTSITGNDAWMERAVFISPQSSNGNFPGLRRGGLEIEMDEVNSSSYLAPHLSPPLVTYQSGGLPQSEGILHNDIADEQAISRNMEFDHESYAGIIRHSRLWQMSEGCPDTVVYVEDSSEPQTSFISFLDEGKLERYLASYQMHVDPVFPVLHPMASYRLCFGAVLKNAVAALGSQFCNHLEDGKHGIQLNEACIRMLNNPIEWSTQTMQCVLLVELFGRSRSLKGSVRPSRRFRELCDKLFDEHSLQTDTESPLSRLNPREIWDHVDRSAQRAQDTNRAREQCLDDIWRDWIDYETRQRLRSACFIFDSHQARYYGHDRELPNINADNTLLLLPCHEGLWLAPSGAEWFQRVRELNYSTVESLRPINISTEQCNLLPLSGQCLVLASHMARFPPKETIFTSPLATESYDQAYDAVKTLFPNSLVSHAHLALYHTPLQDILAFTGESWLFGRKITSSSEMAAIKDRVTRWIRSKLALRAVWHACHVIQIFLSQSSAIDDSVSYLNVSDYWAAYTAAIICSLFGRASPQHRQHHRRPSSVTKTASSSSNSSFSNITALNYVASRDEFGEMRAGALTYTAGMLSVEPAELGKAQMRHVTATMLAAVRWKLEIEASEGEPQCAMLVDACNVLDRILESGNN